MIARIFVVSIRCDVPDRGRANRGATGRRMVGPGRRRVRRGMQLRGKLLAAAVPTAIVMAGLAQAPASAATHWQVLYQTPRHVKAEACRTAVYTSSQGHRVRAVKWRGDATAASL